jgi:hypothetical protein
MRPSPILALALSIPLLATGCIKSMLINGQIAGTREAAGSFNTIGDYELARSAASAGLIQFEGMHELAPDNEDALFLLTQGWVGYGYAFPQDEWDVAVDKGDDELADYQKKRALLAYNRAVFYGVELLSHKAKDFDAAKKNDITFKAWLKEHFGDKDDVPNLFWLGYAWLARADISKEEPPIVAEVYVGVDLIEQAVALTPEFEHFGGLVVLAAYHSRPLGELEDGKKLFESAIEKSQSKNLLAMVTYAQTYACNTGNRPLYEKLLNDVLSAQDPDPSQRLTNTLAKRKAKRYLGKQRMMDCGMDVSSPKKS